MNKRENTIPVKIGNIQIGGNNRVIIQSMCDIKTSNIDEVVKEINECALLGADMMRVSILDKQDAFAIKEIKKRISIPIVADIHFDYKLGILAIENGADKIRINPGNFGSDEKLKELIDVLSHRPLPTLSNLEFQPGTPGQAVFADGELRAVRQIDQGF